MSHRRNSNAILCVLTLALAPTVASAQSLVQIGGERHPIRHLELIESGRSVTRDARRSKASEAFDASFYHLQIVIDFAQEQIDATTRIVGSFSAPRAELRLDLLSNMNVGAVRNSAGAALAYVHSNDVLTIDLGRTVTANEAFSVEVDYDGQPQATGFGSFTFSTRDGHPAAWTLSEPYGAKSWWPGKDHPSDKADSARISITVPDGLRVGSNGILESVTQNAGTSTYEWITRKPIAPYLISFAAGPYRSFEQTYIRPDSLVADLGALSMPVLHYKYTSDGTASLPDGWAEVIDALAVFEWWFGPYPFANEKYGHAEFGWGGGMEHQTMTSMGGTGVGLMTHELTHQWFGDAVTTETWPHLWLNEGFASYGEILYWESMAQRYPGLAELTLRNDQKTARAASGTLVVEDTTSVSNLFAGSRVYTKGSAVLHMLRFVLGDEDFRRMLKSYIADPDLSYGTATTADLERVAESVSQQSLDTFFRQWVTEGTGYPEYRVEYLVVPADGGFQIAVHILQLQESPVSNVLVFEMPVVLSVETDSGEERFIVQNNERDQVVELWVEERPISLRFDPDGVLLRNEVVSITESNPRFPVGSFVVAVSPNPSSSRLLVEVQPSVEGILTVELIDLLGRNVQTLWDAPAGTAPISIRTMVDTVPAGVYIVLARSGSVAQSEMIVVVH